MINKKIVIILIVFFGLSLVLLSNFRIANTQSSNKIFENRLEIETLDKDFPVVSLVSEKIEKIDKRRVKTNEKFDKSDWVKKIVSNNVTAVNRLTHWQIGLPALPTNKSDAVVTGLVTSSAAFLSNDETGIYSEFSVKLSNLIKNNQNDPLELDSTILVQRAGGRLSYPSGKILTYSVHGQAMPRINNKYVFFLTYNQAAQTYNILTAYEIDNGKIIALDGQKTNSGSGFEMTKYNGFDEQQFMNELQLSLYSQIDPAKEKVTP